MKSRKLALLILAEAGVFSAAAATAHYLVGEPWDRAATIFITTAVAVAILIVTRRSGGTGSGTGRHG